MNKIPYRNFKMNNFRDYPFADLVRKADIGNKYFIGMICVIRMSKTLMYIIYNYDNEKKTLFIDEVLFSTLAYKNNLIIIKPSEFNTIYYNKNWNKNIINNINNLYHPVKNINLQYDFRNIFNVQSAQIQYNQPALKLNKKIMYYKR